MVNIFLQDQLRMLTWMEERDREQPEIAGGRHAEGQSWPVEGWGCDKRQ